MAATAMAVLSALSLAGTSTAKDVAPSNLPGEVSEPEAGNSTTTPAPLDDLCGGELFKSALKHAENAETSKADGEMDAYMAAKHPDGPRAFGDWGGNVEFVEFESVYILVRAICRRLEQMKNKFTRQVVEEAHKANETMRMIEDAAIARHRTERDVAEARLEVVRDNMRLLQVAGQHRQSGGCCCDPRSGMDPAGGLDAPATGCTWESPHFTSSDQAPGVFDTACPPGYTEYSAIWHRATAVDAALGQCAESETWKRYATPEVSLSRTPEPSADGGAKAGSSTQPQSSDDVVKVKLVNVVEVKPGGDVIDNKMRKLFDKMLYASQAKAREKLGQNKPATLTPTEVHQINDLFDTIDPEHNGKFKINGLEDKISALGESAKQLIAKHGGLSHLNSQSSWNSQEFFNWCDVDADGFIGREEFMDCMRRNILHLPPNISAVEMQNMQAWVADAPTDSGVFKVAQDIVVDVPLEWAWEAWPRDFNISRIMYWEQKKEGIVSQAASPTYNEPGSHIDYTTSDGVNMTEESVLKDNATHHYQYHYLEKGVPPANLSRYQGDEFWEALNDTDSEGARCRLRWTNWLEPRPTRESKLQIWEYINDQLRPFLMLAAGHIKEQVEARYEEHFQDIPERFADEDNKISREIERFAGEEDMEHEELSSNASDLAGAKKLLDEEDEHKQEDEDTSLVPTDAPTDKPEKDAVSTEEEDWNESGDLAPLQNAGKNCYFECGNRAGLCSWCGHKNACCGPQTEGGELDEAASVCKDARRSRGKRRHGEDGEEEEGKKEDGEEATPGTPPWECLIPARKASRMERLAKLEAAKLVGGVATSKVPGHLGHRTVSTTTPRAATAEEQEVFKQTTTGPGTEELNEDTEKTTEETEGGDEETREETPMSTTNTTTPSAADLKLAQAVQKLAGNQGTEELETTVDQEGDEAETREETPMSTASTTTPYAADVKLTETQGEVEEVEEADDEKTQPEKGENAAAKECASHDGEAKVWECDFGSNGQTKVKHGEKCKVVCKEKDFEPKEKEIECTNGKLKTEPSCAKKERLPAELSTNTTTTTGAQRDILQHTKEQDAAGEEDILALVRNQTKEREREEEEEEDRGEENENKKKEMEELSEEDAANDDGEGGSGGVEAEEEEDRNTT